MQRYLLILALLPGLTAHGRDFVDQAKTPEKESRHAQRAFESDKASHDKNRPLGMDLNCGSGPVDLETGALPSIVLSGETHYTHGAHEAMLVEHESVKAGKTSLGLESVFADKEEDRQNYLSNENLPVDSPVFGIEDEYAFAVVVLLGHNEELAEKATFGMSPNSLVYELRRNKFMKNTWESLSKTSTDPTEKAIFAVINACLDEDPPACAGRISKLSAEHPLNHSENPVHRSLGRKWLMELVSQGEREPTRTSSLVPAGLKEKVEKALAIHDPRKINSPEIVVFWRDRLMARNILKLYCRALEEKKDLHITLGNHHLRGVEMLLSKETGGRVPIVSRTVEAGAFPSRDRSTAASQQESPSKDQQNKGAFPLGQTR